MCNQDKGERMSTTFKRNPTLGCVYFLVIFGVFFVMFMDCARSCKAAQDENDESWNRARERYREEKTRGY